MIRLEEWMEIKTLYQEGHAIRQITRLTGRSRNTVRKVLRAKAPETFKKPQRKSKLDIFKEYVRERYGACRLSSVRLIEEIRSMGYTGSITTLRRWVHLELKAPGRALAKLTVRFETAPGEQAQADWAECGTFDDPVGHKKVSIYCFVMVLGYSRYMYICFKTSMKIDSLIECHKQAFEYFGGWPGSILYDNMKQVRLSQREWNPLFLDFANHYGFIPKTCRPYRARTKGKVERMVDYVKDNFLAGRSFLGLEDLNSQAMHWLESTAHVRVHGTTGRRPCDLLAQEKLTALESTSPYRLAERQVCKVDSSSMVRFDRSRYSVPPQYTGQEVIVEHLGQKILVKRGDVILAEHDRATQSGECVVNKEHIQELWKLSLKRKEVVPSCRWHVSFTNEVLTMPLSSYEEVAR